MIRGASSMSKAPMKAGGRSNPETSKNEEVQAAEKKKKKKPTKEARRRKREEEVLKGIYGPKDSHIHMISPAVMEKIRSESQPSYAQSSSRMHGPGPSSVQSPPWCLTGRTSWGTPRPPWGSLAKSGPPKVEEFPSLGASAKEDPDEEGWETDKEVKKEEEPDGVPRVHDTSTQTEEPVSDIPELAEPAPGTFSKKKPSKKPMIVSLEALLAPKMEKTLDKKSPTTRQPKKDPNEAEGKVKKGMQKAGNLLDSSGILLIHRGKIREKPKKKRTSKLKQAILKTRLLRKFTIAKSFGTVGSPELVVSEEVVNNSELNSADKIEPSQIHPEMDQGVKVEFNSRLDVMPEMVLSEPVQVAINPPENVKPEMAETEKEVNIFRILMDEAEKVIETIVESAPKAAENPIPPEIINKVKSSIHTRRWRTYCDMYTTKELHGHVIALMKELYRFQDRLYHTDSVKYKTKKKFIHGIKDVTAYLNLGKVSLLILAPDIESNDAKGGLDDKIGTLIQLSKEKKVPCVFSGNRFILGKPIRIKNPVSVIGILDKQGAEELFKRVLEEAEKLRGSYAHDFTEKASHIMLSMT